jgi:septal ring factor EnvC (AmiA/AmiB activator)
VSTPARKLAAATVAAAGVAAAAAAFVIVRGLPGLLYAGGICLAAFVGAVAIVAGRAEKASVVAAVAEEEPAAAPKPRWRRKSHIIAELELELAATTSELEEHRQALANLAAQRTRESEAARRNAQDLEQQIQRLVAERDGLLELVAEEQNRFGRTLDELGGGIGRHGNELAELERAQGETDAAEDPRRRCRADRGDGRHQGRTHPARRRSPEQL